MNKAYIFLTVFILIFLGSCGTAKNTGSGDVAETPVSTVTEIPGQTPAINPDPSDGASRENSETLPSEYSEDENSAEDDEENFKKALNGFLTAELGQYFAPLEHCIPFTILVDLDDEDKENVKVYGIFWVQDYKLNGTVLENVSGGCFPGVVKGKKTDGIWKFTEMERVVSGAGNAESAKEIFGARYDAYSMLISDDTVKENVRKEAVKEYVKANGLNVTAYKFYGSDPVLLK
jgi:hypothetical protein